MERVRYVSNELLWEGVRGWAALGEVPTGHIHTMRLVDPGQGCGSRGIWDPISLNTCFTNQPAHGTERRQDTAGQHKRFVPFSNSSVLGSPGQFWMSGQGHHPIPLWPTQCHDMKTKSFRGQGCSMTLAKCNDRFGGSVLYPFEKGQILFNTLDRKLADLA